MSTETPGQQPAAGGTTPPAGNAEHPAGTTPPAGNTFTPAETPWAGAKDMYTIGEGDKARPWYEGIAEDPVRELMKAKGYKNPNEVAMAYHNLNKLQNNAPDAMVIPKDAKDKEGWDKVYTKLGRPETIDKYPEFKTAEGREADANLMKLGKEIFFELGASPDKAQAMVDKWENFVTETQKSMVEADRVKNETEIAELEKKWGGELEANKAAAIRVMKSVGIPNELLTKVEGNIGAAGVVELLAMIGKASSEGSFKGSGNGGGDPNDPNTMTPEQAQARITALNADKDFQAKYTDKKNPEHKTALELMEKLHARATPPRNK
ncbi:hypothetical protein EKK58_09270 [Candidatus Dependentiae bacterium]|nr:MAG: hypothetical protein EKK58_09270 [Candidatus Dependentiae bacterium]